ncbi:hypothetical protein BRCON_1955 [Candidatus Sumerlaea chitinivorans]|uniref:Uncharacterized protein n=1 Tax=Sumerlaea chitinivorans TaxID=2250252 RepID=A0A2Z4Y7V9_SUMC1|nr:hypothetical protein BRCON_1955 [Candidatus Sumerlaea chitinivorans]
MRVALAGGCGDEALSRKRRLAWLGREIKKGRAARLEPLALKL